MHGIKENKAELHYLMPSSFEYVETRTKNALSFFVIISVVIVSIKLSN